MTEHELKPMEMNEQRWKDNFVEAPPQVLHLHLYTNTILFFSYNVLLNVNRENVYHEKE